MARLTLTSVVSNLFSLFCDSFLDEGPISGMVNYVHISNSDLHINDILVNGVWQWNHLYTAIPANVKALLMNIALHANTREIYMLRPGSDGIYTTPSAYRWISQEPNV